MSVQDASPCSVIRMGFSASRFEGGRNEMNHSGKIFRFDQGQIDLQGDENEFAGELERSYHFSILMKFTSKCQGQINGIKNQTNTKT